MLAHCHNVRNLLHWLMNSSTKYNIASWNTNRGNIKNLQLQIVDIDRLTIELHFNQHCGVAVWHWCFFNYLINLFIQFVFFYLIAEVLDRGTPRYNIRFLHLMKWKKLDSYALRSGYNYYNSIDYSIALHPGHRWYIVVRICGWKNYSIKGLMHLHIYGPED